MANETGADLVTELVATLAALRTPDEIEAFLRDLLSPRELLNCASRWQIVRQVAEGATYADIQKLPLTGDTKVGGATILRARRALSNSHGGFRVALERTARSVELRRPRSQRKPSSRRPPPSE